MTAALIPHTQHDESRPTHSMMAALIPHTHSMMTAALMPHAHSQHDDSSTHATCTLTA